MSLDEKIGISTQSVVSPKDELYVHGLRVGNTSTHATGRIRVVSNPAGSFTVTIGKRTQTVTPDTSIDRTATAIKTAFDTTSSTQPPCAVTLTVSGASIALKAHQIGSEGNTVALATNSSDLEVTGSTLSGGCSSIDGFCSLGGVAFEDRPVAASTGTVDVTRRPTAVSDSVDITVAGTAVPVPSRDETLSGVASTATIVFTDKPNEGHTITLIDSDGTSVVFEIDDTEDGVTGSNVAVTEIAENGGGGTGTAVDLAAKINAQSSLDMSAAVPTTGKVVITQGTTGSAGKTAIIADASFTTATSTLPSRFSFGVTAAVAATSTFTFSDKPVEESTITIEDRDRNALTFEVDNEADGVTAGNIAVNGISAAGGGATGTAADLTAKINASSLNVTAANPSSGVITLAQDMKGAEGNTTIRVDSATNWNASTSVNVPSAFTGGVGQGGNTRAEFLNQATQKINNTQASLIGDAFTGLKVLQSPEAADSMKFNIPSAIGGAGADITITFQVYTGLVSAGANEIKFAFVDGESVATTAARIRDTINGIGSSHSGYVAYGSGAGTTAAGIAGITAYDGATTGAVNVFCDDTGTGGNSAIFQVTTGVGRLAGLATAYAFTGGRSENLGVTASNDGVSRLTVTASSTGLAGDSITLAAGAASDLTVTALSGGSDGRGFTNTTETITFGGAEFSSSGASNENLNIRSSTGDLSLQGSRFANGAAGTGTYKLLNNPATSFILTVDGTAHTITPGASSSITLKAASDAINAGAAAANFTASYNSDTLTLTADRVGTRLNDTAFTSNTADIVPQNRGKILGGSTLFEQSFLKGETNNLARGHILVLQDANNAVVVSYPGPRSIQYDFKARGSVSQMCTDIAAEINNDKAGLLASAGSQGIVINSPTGGETYVITIPAKAGGSGSAITLKFLTSLSGSPASNSVEVVCAGGASNATVGDRVKLAINGSGGDSNVAYGSGGGTTSAGIAGVTATDGPSTDQLDLHVTLPGKPGNSATFVPNSTKVSPVASSQSFNGGGYSPITATAGSTQVLLFASPEFGGAVGNQISLTTADASKMALTTSMTGGTTGPSISNTVANVFDINGISFLRGTNTPGAYPVKSNPQVLCPGLSQLYQINLDYDDFDGFSTTSLGITVLDLPNIPLHQGTGLGMVVQEVFIYKSTSFTSSAGGTLTAQVGCTDSGGFDSGAPIGADAFILATDITASGNALIGAVAAEKGSLQDTGPTAVLLEGTSMEKITVTLKCGSGNLTNLTAGAMQLIVRYWTFPTIL